MRWQELADQDCSVARTVSVIGDRWSLLVLRDCFMRVRRFEHFQARLGITRPVLADRLRKLVTAGVLEKTPYQQNPPRYEYRLTARGLDLHPVIMAIVHWGDVHMATDGQRPLLHRHRACGHLFDPVMVCSQCAAAVGARDVTVEPGVGRGAPARRGSMKSSFLAHPAWWVRACCANACLRPMSSVS